MSGSDAINGILSSVKSLLGALSYKGHSDPTNSDYDAYVAESELINASGTWKDFFSFRVPVRKSGRIMVMVRVFNTGGSSSGTTARIGLIRGDDSATRVESNQADLTAFDTERYAVSMANVPAGFQKFTVQCYASSNPNARWRAITYDWQFIEDGV